MLLYLDKSDVPMKRVYLHSEKLGANPERVAAAQALTLDLLRPRLGLKGTHGLYGSEEWWSNIGQRKMPLLFISGIILRSFVAGPDGGDENNGIDLLLDDGSERVEGIYVNVKADILLFRAGCRVELVYALDELKKQPGPEGGINYLEVPLEMAISLQPVGFPRA